MKWILVFSFFCGALSGAETKLALNWKAEPQFGGFYEAQSLLPDLKILEGGSGTPTVQMLTFGQVDLAIVSAEEILISNEKNPQKTVVALFAVYQTNPQVLITLENRGFKTLEQLLKAPGIVSAQPGLTYVQYLKKKYPNSNLKWVPYLGGISGLLKEKNYSQQGFLTSEPLIAEKQGLKVQSFLIADSGFNPYTTVVAVRREDYEKNKDKYQKIIEAFRQGWKKYLENPQKTNGLMGKMNQALDAETFEKSAKLQKHLIETKSLGSMKLERWDTLNKTLKDLGILKKDLKSEDQFINL